MKQDPWLKLTAVAIAGIIIVFVILWGLEQFSGYQYYNGYNRNMNMTQMYRYDSGMNGYGMNGYGMNMQGNRKMQDNRNMQGNMNNSQSGMGMMNNMMGGM